MLCKYALEIVKLFHLLELGLAPGKIDHRAPALPLVDVADQEAVVLAALNIRGKRTGRPPAQLKLEAKVANDLLREQTDQVGVARQPGVIIRKHLLRGGRPSYIIILLY